MKYINKIKKEVDKLKSDIIEWLSVFFYLSVLLAVGFGWINNILKIFEAGPIMEWTVWEVMRVVGVFFVPLGVILGYI